MKEVTDEKTLTQPPLSDSNHRPYGNHAMMLTDATDASVVDDTPTVVCCPNCAETVAVFETGVPAAVTQFKRQCSTCDVALRRSSAVAVDAAYADLVDAPQLTEMTQAYWDRRLQAGITNSRDNVRNDEYAELFAETADAFGWDWEQACPLCRRSKTALDEAGISRNGQLDYHHWSETPDQGVTLCRECHDIIGFDVPDTTLEEKARKWGFGSRNDLQVIRLALREAVAIGRQLHPAMATNLVERYNLIQTPAEVESLLWAVCRDDDLYEQVVDDTLWQSFEHRR